MTETILEIKVINKFIVEAKRERCIAFLQNVKTRSKFISEFSSGKVFIPHFFEEIKGNENETIINASKKLGVKDCYIISENKSIDGKRMDIETALKNAVSSWSDTETLIVFGDADILYREHDGIRNKWISKL